MTTENTPSPSESPAEASEPNAGRCAVATGSAVCFEIAAQHYGYIPGAPVARTDREVIALAQDLMENPVIAELLLAARRLEWARKNCRVVYYPPDGGYPIEHAPHANKDMWAALAVAADTSSPNIADHPDALSPVRE